MKIYIESYYSCMKEILYVRIVISYKSLIIKNFNVQKSIKCTWCVQRQNMYQSLQHNYAVIIFYLIYFLQNITKNYLVRYFLFLKKYSCTLNCLYYFSNNANYTLNICMSRTFYRLIQILHERIESRIYW